MDDLYTQPEIREPLPEIIPEEDVEIEIIDEPYQHEEPVYDNADNEPEPEAERPQSEVEEEEKDYKRMAAREKKEKYRLKAELKKLQEERDHILNLYHQTDQAALLHYDDKLKIKMDQVKKQKVQAMDEADYDQATEVDAELMRLVAEQQQLNQWRVQQAYAQQNPQRASQSVVEEYEEEPEQRELSSDGKHWLKRNSFLLKDSADYEPEIADEVRNYVMGYEMRLVQEGREDEYDTPEYYQNIDRFIQRHFNKAPQPYKKAPQMRDVSRQYPVAPVRASGMKTSPMAPRKETVRLTTDEAALAKIIQSAYPGTGLSAAKFAEYAMNDRKNNQQVPPYGGSGYGR